LNKIAELRKEKNISQKKLGEKLQVAQATISAWETGERTPNLKSLKKLCEEFQVSLTTLIGEPSLYEKAGISKQEIEGTNQAITAYISALEQLPEEQFKQLSEMTKLMFPHFKELLEKARPGAMENFSAVAAELSSKEE
jgi:transcriptional regulator with XRE-family HTH domain